MHAPKSSSAGKGLSANRYKPLLTLAASLPVMVEQLQHTPIGKAGVCFRPLSEPFFLNLDINMGSMLISGERVLGTQFRMTEDSYGFRWVIFRDGVFQDLVIATALLALGFARNGFEQQLLAADFPFQQERQEVHWIYSFKQRAFYPFVPLSEPERDNILELSLGSSLRRKLPIEKETQRWYALWGAPFDAV